MGNFPQTKLLVFPELHLFGDGTPDLAREEALRASAEPLDGERVEGLKQLAKDNQIWLVAGSVCEAGDNGEIFNTQIVLSPNGELVGSYRKVLSWRPAELYDPSNKFEVVHTGELNLGLSICYDAWFPESTRQLAWSGAEVILNVVKTTTPDRQQQLVLAQANAIVKQVFVVSVNVAGPTGMGRSLVVDPEGKILASFDDSEPDIINVDFDLDEVKRVRAEETAGTNRMWSQFRP